ncbi:MAG: argininosuccinate lyase, partial [Ilumatobacteraceae bacterium]
AAADVPALGATDLAEFLVRAGLGFRDAHAIVGSLVRRSLDGEGSLVALVEADPRLGPEAAKLLAPGIGVTMRTTPGGAGPGPVAEQLVAFRRTVEEWSRTVASFVPGQGLAR